MSRRPVMSLAICVLLVAVSGCATPSYYPEGQVQTIDATSAMPEPSVILDENPSWGASILWSDDGNTTAAVVIRPLDSPSLVVLRSADGSTWKCDPHVPCSLSGLNGFPVQPRLLLGKNNETMLFFDIVTTEWGKNVDHWMLVTSKDGAEWSEPTALSPYLDIAGNVVLTGDGRYMAFCNRMVGSPDAFMASRLYTSDDGLLWFEFADQDFAINSLFQAKDGRFYAAGYGRDRMHSIFVSDDGRKWSRQGDTGWSGCSLVQSDDGTFYMASTHRRTSGDLVHYPDVAISMSTDGRRWSMPNVVLRNVHSDSGAISMTLNGQGEFLLLYGDRGLKLLRFTNASLTNRPFAVSSRGTDIPPGTGFSAAVSAIALAWVALFLFFKYRKPKKRMPAPQPQVPDRRGPAGPGPP